MCAAVRQAVADAKKEWGRQQLAEADAEDRLAFACERAPTQDPVTSKLRAAFQVRQWASPVRHADLADRCLPGQHGHPHVLLSAH